MGKVGGATRILILGMSLEVIYYCPLFCSSDNFSISLLSGFGSELVIKSVYKKHPVFFTVKNITQADCVDEMEVGAAIPSMLSAKEYNG